MPPRRKNPKSRKARGKQAQRTSRQRQHVARPSNTRPGHLLGPLGGLAGSALGAYIGGPTGARIGGITGSSAGQMISTLTGLGSYRVKSNLFAAGQGIPAIRNRSNKPGTVIIRHKEYLGDVTSSSTAGAFRLESYTINPGIITTFPWLSQIALNYEEFEFQGLLFEFRSMSGDALNSVNTALGTVIMATNYNVLNPPFATKAEMDAYEFSNSCRPSETMVHLIECSPQQNVLSELYVRANSVPAGADARFYDLGNFQIATSGMQGTSVNVGEIWVSYQVALLKPRLYSALGRDSAFFHISNSSYSSAAPLGSGVVSTDPNNTIGAVVSGTTITFPRRPVDTSYSIEVAWKGAVAAAATIPISTLGTGVIGYPTLYPDNSDGVAAPSNGSSTTRISDTSYVTVKANASNRTFAYGVAGVFPASPEWVDIRILQVPTLS